MENYDIEKLTKQDINKKICDLVANMSSLQIKLKKGEAKERSQIPNIRKEIARLKTALNNK